MRNACTDMAKEKWTTDSLLALKKKQWTLEPPRVKVKEVRVLCAEHPEHRFVIDDGLYMFVRLRKSDVRYQWQTRIQVNGQRRWLSLGEFKADGSGVGYADANAEKAKVEAWRNKAKTGEADHPIVEVQRARDVKRAAPTVANVFDEMIEAKRLSSPRKGGKPVRERTIQLLREPFNMDIASAIGNRKIEKITKNEIKACIDAPLKRGSPGAANQVYRILKMLVRFSIAKDYLTANVMAGIDNPRPYNPQSAKVNAAKEDGELISLLRGVADSEMWPPTKYAIKFGLLTGARPGEIRNAKNEHFNLKKRTWTVPAENAKMDKAFVLHLSEQALAVVAEAMVFANGDYVFSGAQGEQMGRASVNQALRRLYEQQTEGGRRYKPHDLRRTFKTTLSRLGVAPHVSELCLSHQNKDALQRAYDGYGFVPEMKAAWDTLGAHIEAIMRGGATVVPIFKKA
jgi:integrase